MGWGKIGPSAAEWCGKACNELEVFPNVFAKNGKHLESVQKSNSLTPHDPRGCAWDPAEELARETPQAYLSRFLPETLHARESRTGAAEGQIRAARPPPVLARRTPRSPLTVRTPMAHERRPGLF